MNSLADILSQKADDLFASELSPTIPTTSPPLSIQPPVNTALPATQLERMLYAMKAQIDSMLRLVHGERIADEQLAFAKLDSEERVVEGNFTGNSMLGNDGKEYPMPPNYASKSKLVEGDKMKLTITKSGSFIYKQIGPVERKRVIGELIFDATLAAWQARVDGKHYKILTASITFYKGKSGDEVIFIIPRDKTSLWCAVDNIISK